MGALLYGSLWQPWDTCTEKNCSARGGEVSGRKLGGGFLGGEVSGRRMGGGRPAGAAGSPVGASGSPVGAGGGPGAFCASPTVPAGGRGAGARAAGPELCPWPGAPGRVAAAAGIRPG